MNVTYFTQQCLWECYNLIRDCTKPEHFENPEVISATLSIIKRYKVALPPNLYETLNSFIEEVIRPFQYDDPDFFHTALLTTASKHGLNVHEDILDSDAEESLEKILVICMLSADLEAKVDTFAEQYLKPYLI